MKQTKYSTTQTVKRLRLHRKFLLPLLGLLLLVVVFGVLEATGTTHLFHETIPATKVVVHAGKPTPVPTPNISTQPSGDKQSAVDNTGRTIGGGTDTNGATTATTSPSQWIVSQSGNITVKQPVANAKLKSGSILSGTAKVSQVNFRLIDSKVGVISEGTLSVVNGNFSGALNFQAQSSSGRLDVFNTDSQGVELNEVQISVSF